MAYSSIVKPSDYFNTVLYTGNGGTNAITGVGFQPDWTWIKGRSIAEQHMLYDAVRGVTKDIRSDSTGAENTNASTLTAFGTDGFTLGSLQNVNNNTSTYASWNWLGANGTATNTDGSITSTVSANTTSGFSIVTYTGTGSAATIGHGLGVAPACIIFKTRNTTSDWFVYHQSTGATNRTKLNQAVTSSASTFINDTTPSSTVFNTEGGGATGTNGNTYIAYCFAEKKGYSKFGSYTGNGSTDGTFVYTGFKPALVIIKNSSTGTTDWTICDNKRAGYNASNYRLFPNQNSAESTSNAWEMYSNGFKMTSTGSFVNQSGDSYIYMAFAEAPLVGTNNIPATGR